MDPVETGVPNFFECLATPQRMERCFLIQKAGTAPRILKNFSLLQIILCRQRVRADSPKKKLDFVRNMKLPKAFPES